ncbi:MAG: zinc dependent phospholipase C family protein [Erysipelotrichaceae bacterium]|nr:zinc dependent phospholipase C family protein [Erysipelotrichaceae bacterium]
MPTTYAHWRFGCDCIETLPEDLKNVIQKNRELFDLGVHGPDIFFYDLKRPELFDFGSKMHRQSGRTFFESAIRTYQSYDDRKDAMLAYMLGFLSHFVLDSQTHGYVNRKDKLSPSLSHNKIESEYDGHLIRKDGLKVAKANRAKSLKPDADKAKIIARFFPYDEKAVLRTIKGQLLVISGLYCRTDLKRKALAAILEKMGKFDYRDLIVQKTELDLCKDSNLRLDKLMAYALETYPVLADSLMNSLRTGSLLCDYFDHDYDPDIESIPILSYEEEQDYVPEKIV